MRSHHLYLSLTLLLPLAWPGRAPAGPQAEPALTAADRKYLDELQKELLFDPKGAERVSVKMTVRTVGRSAVSETVEGWWRADKKDKAGRVYFIDGASIPAPPAKEMDKVDFIATCKELYDPPPGKEVTGREADAVKRAVFSKMLHTGVGVPADLNLVLAAWLHRLGRDGLAARALAAARAGKGDPRQRLRDDLAWSAFAALVHAYESRADEEALAHGERLLRLYAAEAKDARLRQAARVVEDLKRRQKDGTFGKAPPAKLHEGFEKWAFDKKVAYLLHALEEVDVPQAGEPGGVDLASDLRVEALIRLGDAAVPDLIDALENDVRLTRSVHCWRSFARSRTVLSVREAVLTALMSILRVRAFEPRSTGDNFTSRDDEAAKEIARCLRAYWKQYGALPFDERMMKVLTNPEESFDARREAALNLAALTWERRLGTTVWTDSSKPRPDRKPNPAVAKFSKPTAAEAMLAALDADLTKNANASDYRLRVTIERYLWALVELGDRRVGPALTRRAATADIAYLRHQYEKAARALGEADPFTAIAEAVRTGTWVLPAGAPGEQELRRLVATLIDVGTPETDRALAAITDRKHPFYRLAADRVLQERLDEHVSQPWFAHPFCLRILRGALEDKTPTGAKLFIEKGTLWHQEKSGKSAVQMPAFLADPTVRREAVAERVCDAAALKLVALVVGLPPYHPLLKDADKRLGALKTAFDRFAGNYRKATFREWKTLGAPAGMAYLPDLRPLGRAATADEVKAGKAVFHLDGKGSADDLELPAIAVWKRDAKQKEGPRLLVVQAEVDADGAVVYGVITLQEIRRVSAAEVTLLKGD